jgi:hypothetical protein
MANFFWSFFEALLKLSHVQFLVAAFLCTLSSSFPGDDAMTKQADG